MKIESIIRRLQDNVNFGLLAKSYIQVCKNERETGFEILCFERELLNLLSLKAPGDTISYLMRRHTPEFLVRNLILCYLKQGALNQDLKRRSEARKLALTKVDVPEWELGSAHTADLPMKAPNSNGILSF